MSAAEPTTNWEHGQNRRNAEAFGFEDRIQDYQAWLNGVRGSANELIVLGILLPFYPESMLSAVANSSHDMSIRLPVADDPVVRVQIKTAHDRVVFTGGSRAGRERLTLTKEKVYPYTSDKADVVIGIDELSEIGRYDLYFVPTRVIDRVVQLSISNGKIAFTKNKLEIISRCKDPAYVEWYLTQINVPLR